MADRYALHTVADLIIKQPPLRIATGYNDGINVIGYAVEKVLNAYGATWDSLEQWGGKWFVADTQLPPLTWFATGEVDALFHETAEGDKVLLDEILGNGFSSLALTAQPYLLFAAVTQPIWDCLQVHRVAVLPQHAAWYVAPPEIIVVRAQDQTLTKIAAGYAGYLLLLRPDHYVAATIPLAGIAHESDIISTLLRNTTIQASLVTTSYRSDPYT